MKVKDKKAWEDAKALNMEDSKSTIKFVELWTGYMEKELAQGKKIQ